MHSSTALNWNIHWAKEVFVHLAFTITVYKQITIGNPYFHYYSTIYRHNVESSNFLQGINQICTRNMRIWKWKEYSYTCDYNRELIICQVILTFLTYNGQICIHVLSPVSICGSTAVIPSRKIELLGIMIAVSSQRSVTQSENSSQGKGIIVRDIRFPAISSKLPSHWKQCRANLVNRRSLLFPCVHYTSFHRTL